MFFTYLVTTGISKADEVASGFTGKFADLFGYILEHVPSWIAGVVVFIASFFFAKLAKSAVESRIGDKIDEEHQEILVLSGRVTYFGTLILGVTIALKIAGIDLTTILAAVAFGIGFALQDLIMNFLSGVLILLSKQFTIGDFIKVGNTLGKVMEIQTRATILKAIDGTKVIVPNSEIFSNQVVSYTTNPTRRIVIPLFVAYDTDLRFAIKVALKVLKAHPKLLKKPTPSIIVANYGDSSIDLSARFWVGSRDGWFQIKSEILHQMLEAFNEAGIVIPYNILHVETGGDTKDEWNNATTRRKKKMEEMHLSNAIATDVVDTAQPAQVPTLTAPATTAAADGAPAATLDMPIAGTPAPVVMEAVDPTGAYQDQLDIDGQA